MRRLASVLLLASSLALGGCAASIAAGLAGAAVRAANAGRAAETFPDLRRAAVDACSARAAQHGRVHIIDTEQTRDRVTVWGTVADELQRRAFVCAYDRRVSSFTLRAIPTPRPPAG